MARFVKGDIVVVPFPFSNLEHFKKRPALVITELEGDDLILCQITSKTINDKYSVPITNNDFDTGKLNRISNIRPNRLFTIDKKLILYKIGNLKKSKFEQIICKVIEIVKN